VATAMDSDANLPSSSEDDASEDDGSDDEEGKEKPVNVKK